MYLDVLKGERRKMQAVNAFFQARRVSDRQASKCDGGKLLHTQDTHHTTRARALPTHFREINAILTLPHVAPKAVLT